MDITDRDFGFSQQQRGQALPEMLIVLPLVVILVMAIIQISLLYRGKATLNHATFLAARSGALNHGYLAPMRKAFLNKMVALGHILPAARNNATTVGLYANPSTMNLIAARAAMAASHSYNSIVIEWPTQEVFNHFAISHQALTPCSGNDCPFAEHGGKFRLSQEKIFQIPLENQDARIQTLQTINGAKVDLQDANLLSVRSHYCYDLEVPVANFIIWRSLQLVQSASPQWVNCQSVSASFGDNRFLIPMTGRSVIRMQSGFRCEGNEITGSNCENL